MKTVVYSTLMAFRGLVFTICKLWLALGIFSFFGLIVFAYHIDGLGKAWPSIIIMLIAGCVVPQLILTYYNKLIARFADRTIYLPE